MDAILRVSSTVKYSKYKVLGVNLSIAVLKKVRYALCPMPYALCPMPYAQSYLIFLRNAIYQGFKDKIVSQYQVSFRFIEHDSSVALRSNFPSYFSKGKSLLNCCLWGIFSQTAIFHIEPI